MRGREFTHIALFSTKPLNRRIPHRHPLRKLRVIVDQCLHAMDADFEAMYDRHAGRESIPPEQLLRALLIQKLFTVRSERQLMEQLDYNLLFRWFVGLEMDQDVWHHSTFSANRERFLRHEVIGKFFGQVVHVARANDLLSDDHFSVDGTLIEAMGSLKSVVPRVPIPNEKQPSTQPDPGVAPEATVPSEAEASPEATVASETEALPEALACTEAATAPIGKPETVSPTPPDGSLGRNRWVGFKGTKRSNKTHVSETDPDAMLACKGSHQTVKLSWVGHALMENRSGLVTDAMLTQATGTAECEAAEAMATRSIHKKGATLGADKGYDTQAHVANLKAMKIRSHAAQNNKGRKSAIHANTARSKGFGTSQKLRKRVEEIFGWMKCTGDQRKSKFFGKARTEMAFVLSAASYNLVRMMGLFGWRVEAPTGELRPA